ncbi:hypothetical protein M2125_000354 [Polynucleobacter sphagniphilus]|nr:hypothetical protein [Polynucleobacter sphagniphilus]
MEFSYVIFPIFSFVTVYYIHNIIKQLVDLQKLQLKSNELLYEINSKLGSLNNK